MTNDPYSPRVRDLFTSPAHAGRLEGAVEAAIDDQGVRVLLSMASRDGQIEALRFRAWGCPHLLAACEAFCSAYEGRAVSDLARFSGAGLMQSLAVPVEKTGRILVLEDAVRSLGTHASESSLAEN